MRRSEVPKNLLLDSGFWYALYDARDPFHEQANALAKYLDFYTLVIPWPSLYKTLNTRFVRHPEWLRPFEQYVQRSSSVRLPDESYRDMALNSVLRIVRGWRPISLVDMVIRLMLADLNIKIDIMVTFNQNDFADICATRQIAIISS
jgi:predicted nucleic acid-binding protein